MSIVIGLYSTTNAID